MSLEELLAGLRAEYLNELPKKIMVIEAQIAASRNEDLRESFHKLKGTGRTYGLPEISELAELVETICLEQKGAVEAARVGVAVLKDICSARQGGREFPVAADSRLLSLRRLL